MIDTDARLLTKIQEIMSAQKNQEQTLCFKHNFKLFDNLFSLVYIYVLPYNFYFTNKMGLNLDCQNVNNFL